MTSTSIATTKETVEELPIRLTSKIIPGFGRGSKDLGIPTANVSREDMECQLEFESLPCGIYWGFARVLKKQGSEAEDSIGSTLPNEEEVYKAAISVGFNPHYGNKEKTIEPHLIASLDHPLRKASKCKRTYVFLVCHGHINRSLR